MTKRSNTATLTFVEQSTNVVMTEFPTIRNNNCIEEGRRIIRQLANLVMRSGNKLVLEVDTDDRRMRYNCTTFCCPRLELKTLESGAKHLVITDGNNTHTLSPYDNILTLRRVKIYAIGEEF